jgi:hypothetical protein
MRCRDQKAREIIIATLVLPLDPLHHDLLNFVSLYSAVGRMPIRLKSQRRGKCPLSEMEVPHEKLHFRAHRDIYFCNWHCSSLRALLGKQME